MKHDWALITRQVLDALHITTYKLASMLNVDQRTVEHWLRGTVPLHHAGEALLGLHTRYVVEVSMVSSTARVASA